MGGNGSVQKTQQDEIRHLQRLLKKRERELFSIQRIGKALSSTMDIDKLLRVIMQEITALMGAERSTLYIVDADKKELWAKIALKAEIKEIRQKFGRGISGTVALTGEKINIRDAYEDERFDPVTDQKTGYRTRSMLCLPVWDPHSSEDDRKLIAVIQVLNKKRGFFTEEDEDLLEALTSQVAISITNARLFNRIEKKLGEMDLLHEFEQLLNIENDLTKIYRKLLNRTAKHLKARWTIALIPGKSHVTVFAANTAGDNYQDILPLPENIRVEQQWKSRQDMQRFWEKCHENLNISKIPREARGVALLCPIKFHKNPTGILIAMDVGVGNVQDFQDERVLMEFVAQKIARAQELHQLRERLITKERLSAIGRMMSTVVHDIRSPVSTINGFIDLMQDKSTTPDERNEFAEIIRYEIRATMNMITEVLDFAKGKTNILPRKTTVQHIVKVFSPRLEKMCQQYETLLNLEISSQHEIYVDEDKLIRVFYNITKNALEAMGQGGSFTFRVYDEDDQVVFQFSDTGPGIPEEIQSRLFDSFVTSGKESGTGLGLAIVKKIIDEHNGRVVIDTTPRPGSDFLGEAPGFSTQLIGDLPDLQHIS